jgi:hypothetical protein
VANDFSGDSSVKALWRFESGSLTVDSKSTNTLTAANTPTADTGDYKEGAAAAVVVHASHQYFTISDANLATGFPLKSGDSVKKITIAGWVYPTDASSSALIFGKTSYDSGPGLYYNGTSLRCQYNTNDITIGDVLTLGTWHHIALIIDGVTGVMMVRLFKASNLTVTDYILTALGTLSNQSNNFRIGAWSDQDVSYTANCKFDEVVVFDRLLPVVDIDAIRQGIFPVSGIRTGDVFTGTNGSTPNTAIWDNSIPVGATLDIQSNQLRLVTSGSVSAIPSIISLGSFPSDFDVQVDYNLVTYPSTNFWDVGINAIIDGLTNNFGAYRHYWVAGGHRYSSWGGQFSETLVGSTIPTSDTSGKLRITRVGNVFTSYYWNGSAWVQIAQTTITVTSGVRIQLRADSTQSHPAVDFRLDNYLVNVGGVATYDLTTAVAVVSAVSTPILLITRNLTSAPAAVSTVSTPNLGTGRELQTTVVAVSGNYITYGDGGAWGDGRTYGEMPGIVLDIAGGGVVYELTTACAAVSATSNPVAAITRPLTSSPAVVSSTAAILLAILRDLASSVSVVTSAGALVLVVIRPLTSSSAAVSTTSSPILTVLRALQSAIAAVERPLTASLGIQSAVGVPNLLVQRLLATLAAVLSATSDVNLTAGALDFTTAVAIQSQVSNAGLNVVRPLNSSIAGQSAVATPSLLVQRALATIAAITSATSDIQLFLGGLHTTVVAQTQTSDASLAVLRPLSAAVAPGTQTSSITLKVLRDLATLADLVSAAPDITLSLAHVYNLITAVAAQTATSSPTLDLLKALTTAIQVITGTSAVTLKVVRDLVVAIAAQTMVPDIYLDSNLRLFVTSIVVQTQTSNIELILTFRESLRTQSKRFYGFIDSSGLRGSAVKWNPQNYLLDDALKWIVEEEKKAA